VERTQLRLLLRMAANGYNLAKLLRDSGTTFDPTVETLVREIITTRDEASKFQRAQHKAPPLFGVRIHLEKNKPGATIEEPTGFVLSEPPE